LPEPKYIASIADIKHIKDMPEEFIPYVTFKASQEGRILRGDERVAILNVSTTTSYIAVFLDEGKTIEEVEEDVGESSVTLNKDTREVLERLLEERA
jgi:hypothetical protein